VGGVGLGDGNVRTYPLAGARACGDHRRRVTHVIRTHRTDRTPQNASIHSVGCQSQS
jgi:hypothetical protein